MKDAFERDLKQKLEQATPEELGLRPDKDKLWGKIATQPKPKAMPLRNWITHAAAIAAGLLIGAFFLNREQQPTVATGMPRLSSSQKLKIQTDTVYVLQPAREDKDHKTIAPAAIVTRTSQHLEPGLPTVAQEQIAQKQEAPTPEIVHQEITVAGNQQPPKVLHLSDIGNENAMPQSRIIKIPILVQLFASPNLQEDKQASASASVLIRQQLTDTKN